MDVVHQRAAGIDVSKKDAKVCVRVVGKGSGVGHGSGRGSGRGSGSGVEAKVTTWGSTTPQILRLRGFLEERQVTCVVLEATGDYWKPFYYLLEDAGFELILANAGQVKNMPGRKSDVADAAWLADLAAHGLVRASFVPPEPIRQLRDLTRTRTVLTRDRGREINRLESLLEDAGVKLSSVASDLTGVSARAMLEALIAGERDPEVLADLAKARLRTKIPALREALVGRFSDHHAFLARIHLDVIDRLSVAIEELTVRIDEQMQPFRDFHTLICTIPGISRLVADVVIAETGTDMSVFPTANHLASWAGTAPGSHESAGKVKSTKTRPGNPYLKGALGIAAMGAARTKSSQLAAKHRRIAARRGANIAKVAVMRTLLTTIWQMAATGEIYTDLGAGYYLTRDPQRTKRRALGQLRALGYHVTLAPST